MVQGPAARMCRLSVSSWGAEVSVKGWYSVVPRARQAIRTHCPDLYSKLWGRWNCRWVTPGDHGQGSEATPGTQGLTCPPHTPEAQGVSQVHEIRTNGFLGLGVGDLSFCVLGDMTVGVLCFLFQPFSSFLLPLPTKSPSLQDGGTSGHPGAISEFTNVPHFISQ